MNAEVLAVGTELLLGQIANTNAQFISKKFPDVGVSVLYHSVVGDNKTRLKTALEIAFSRADVVVLTGGLGPTYDDMTKETVAEYFGKTLVRDEKCLEKIETYFKSSCRIMAETNKKQADFPVGAKILENSCGTAPGCIIEQDEKIAVLLPGPPKEMQPMFEFGVLPYFKEKGEGAIISRSVYILPGPDMGESSVERRLGELTKGANPSVATYIKPGQVEVRITAKAETEDAANDKINPIFDKVSDLFGDYIFSSNGDSLEETVVKLLIKKGLKISTCESCTGGLIASAITNVSGASGVFEYGFVTYANSAKESMVGVCAKTLEDFGAVSEQTAKEMAIGAREKSGSDIGISATGIAGPTGGTKDKPVGLVYIGYSDKNKTEAIKLNLNGNRDRVRELTKVNALGLVFKNIKDI